LKMPFMMPLVSYLSLAASAHFDWSIQRNLQEEPFLSWSRQEVIQFPSKIKALRHFSGPEVALSSMLEALLEKEDAQVDLLTFFDKGDKSLAMPRAFSLKYRVKLAISWGKARLLLPDKGPIEKEELPTEHFRTFAPVRILLSRAQDTYAPFMVTHGNPSLMAGQKLFVQNCLACHQAREVPTGLDLAKTFLSKGHPVSSKINGSPIFKQKLQRYVDHLSQTLAASKP
jgi:hypothetical protein